ncbi:MAG: hypothetical protein ACREMZ_07060 [Gemmatimonadales bacterium]
MLPAMLLFAACSGVDSTAPESPTSTMGPQDDWHPRQSVPVTVSVNPRNVTVETNQLIRFLAHGRNSAGDSVYAPIAWHATGGTILPDGRFSSAAAGTFMVMGSTSDGDEAQVDTSTVVVVRRHILLASIEITPATTTLAPGVGQSFAVTGYLRSGRAVPVGVTWSATGGFIDAGGNYVAGDTAGTYQVIATNTARTIADTATVTVTAPPAPPLPPAPPAAPPAEPEPALAQLTLMPASATLAPLTTRQFAAYGRNTTGDSVPVSVAFAATGGTVTAGGLYTAGTAAGTYRVIATSAGLADTSTVTVTQPLGSGPGTGIPFGPYSGWDGSTPKAHTELFTLSSNADTPGGIVARINGARNAGMKIMLAMTGGAHSNYITDGKFDLSKWKARQDQYNTATIKTAVANAVADGTVMGAQLIDEPNHRSWGGAVTKAKLDEMADYLRTIFPTLPAGFVGRTDWRESETSRKLDFQVVQYSWRKPEGGTPGDVVTFREQSLAHGVKNRLVIAFSLNVLDGGFKVIAGDPTTYQYLDCPVPLTGGKGTTWSTSQNCGMTPQQIRDWGRLLGSAGCALMLWRYDAGMMADPNYQAAFRDVGATLGTLPAKACRRG